MQSDTDINSPAIGDLSESGSFNRSVSNISSGEVEGKPNVHWACKVFTKLHKNIYVKHKKDAAKPKDVKSIGSEETRYLQIHHSLCKQKYSRSKSIYGYACEERPSEAEQNVVHIYPILYPRHHDDLETSGLTLQDILDRQVQTKIVDGVYLGRTYSSGPKKNVYNLPKPPTSALRVPNNRAHADNSIFEGLARVPIQERFRFIRGKVFSFERQEQNIALKPVTIKSLIYDPEYSLSPCTTISTPRCDGEKVVVSGESKKGLCPYCPRPQYSLFRNSGYKNHLASYHGVFSDSYITPDPFVDPQSREGMVCCPVCAKSVKTGDEKGKPKLYGYLDHFRKCHQQAQHVPQAHKQTHKQTSHKQVSQSAPQQTSHKQTSHKHPTPTAEPEGLDTFFRNLSPLFGPKSLYHK